MELYIGYYNNSIISPWMRFSYSTSLICILLPSGAQYLHVTLHNRQKMCKTRHEIYSPTLTKKMVIGKIIMIFYSVKQSYSRSKGKEDLQGGLYDTISEQTSF